MSNQSALFNSEVENHFVAPAIVQASNLGSDAFNPANKLLLVGTIPLNQSDPYLSDLSPEAQARYLITPQGTADIFNRGRGTWLRDVADIRRIDESHEFHYEDQIVTGLEIYDHSETAHHPRSLDHFIVYEKERASVIRAGWEKAKNLGQNVMIGFSIASPQLIRGYEVCWPPIEQKLIQNNLFDRASALNAMIRQQNDENGVSLDKGTIVTQDGQGNDSVQFTSREVAVNQYPQSVCSIDLTNGGYLSKGKRNNQFVSRPSALLILAPNT